MTPQQASRLVGHVDARRYVLETHYAGAQHPTVLHFGSAGEAIDAAAHRHRCHTGVTHTIVRTLADRHPGLVAYPGSSAAMWRALGDGTWDIEVHPDTAALKVGA